MDLIRSKQHDHGFRTSTLSLSESSNRRETKHQKQVAKPNQYSNYHRWIRPSAAVNSSTSDIRLECLQGHRLLALWKYTIKIPTKEPLLMCASKKKNENNHERPESMLAGTTSNPNHPPIVSNLTNTKDLHAGDRPHPPTPSATPPTQQPPTPRAPQTPPSSTPI